MIRTIAIRQPLVAPCAALALGIAAAQWARFSFLETLISTLLLAGLAGLGLRFAPRTAITACLAGFLVAGVMIGSRPHAPDPLRVDRLLGAEADPLDDPVRLRGWVREPPEVFEDADRFVLQVESVFAATPARGAIRVMAYRRPNEPVLRLDYGQRLEFLARTRQLRNFQNPGSFDRVRYLNRRGIVMTAVVRPGVPFHQLPGQGGSRWEAWLWMARRAAHHRLEVLLASSGADGTTEASILWALLLGERASLDRETTTGFQRAGAYHALVISGLHVGVLALALSWGLRLAMVPLAGRVLVVLVLLGAYALLVGATLPVSRAAWMLAVYMLTSLVFRQRRALNVVAATAFFFLAVDPELLFDAGFQMSFLAVALIAGVAVPLLERTIEPYRRALTDLWNLDRDLAAEPPGAEIRVAEIRVRLRMWIEPLAVISGLSRGVTTALIGVPLRMLVWAGALCLVSAVIQAGLSLPMAAHFQRVSWAGITANLLIMPILTITVPLGLLALATGWQGAAAGAIAGARAMGDVVEWHLLYLPGDWRVPPPPLWLGIAFGVSLAAVALTFGRRRWLQAGTWTAALIALVLLVAHPFPHRFPEGRLELTVLDVGQGESLLLTLPGGETMLIDGGGLPSYGGRSRPGIDIGDAVVSPYLWSRSIQRLDTLVISHADADHAGGVPALLENFEVGELWFAADTLPAEFAGLISAVARRRGIQMTPLRRGDRRRIGEVHFEVLGPSAAPGRRGPRNDQSLVLRARFGQRSFLLTGDIEELGELNLLAGNFASADTVLKVAHHGSKTSTGERFLARTRPAFAVVSSGYRNPFGHPHASVIERLERSGAKILRTDRDGLVAVATDGWRVWTRTYRDGLAARKVPRP